MNNKEIGKKIKSIRESQGISREQLAKKLNVTKYAIINYEQGQRGSSIKILNKIAAALGVSINELLYSNILSDGKSERNLMEMTRDELYDSIYALRNEVSALKELNSTLINNMKEIGKIANIKY